MAFGDYDFAMLANRSQQIAVTGAIVRVRSCTGKINIRIDGGPGANFSAGQGFKMPAGKTFRDLTVTDVSGAANAGVIFIGDASYEDQTFSGSVSVTNLPAVNGAFAETNVAVTAAGVALLAANPARRFVEVINTDPAVTIYITVDGSAVGASGYIPIAPGASWSSPAGFAPTSAINAKSAGANVNATVLEA